MNDVSTELARARELLNLEPSPGAKARVLAGILAGASRQRRSPRRALIMAVALLGASTAAALGMPELARWFVAPTQRGAVSSPSAAPHPAPSSPARHSPPSTRAKVASTSDFASPEPELTVPSEPAATARPPSAVSASTPEAEHRYLAASPSASTSAASTLAQEVAAYEEAAALVSTEPGLAIVRLRAHREHFPGSPLGEEVSVRLVQAFTALGRDADARREAAQFVARYPRSPKRAAMQALVGGEFRHDE